MIQAVKRAACRCCTSAMSGEAAKTPCPMTTMRKRSILLALPHYCFAFQDPAADGHYLIWDGLMRWPRRRGGLVGRFHHTMVLWIAAPSQGRHPHSCVVPGSKKTAEQLCGTTSYHCRAAPAQLLGLGRTDLLYRPFTYHPAEPTPNSCIETT